MPPKSRKIFPKTYHIHPGFTVNLHIISEGYTNEQQFNNDCITLREKLLSLSPFNLLRLHSSFFSIYTFYEASTQSGPRITNNPSDQNFVPGNTPFDSVFNTSLQRLFVNESKVMAIMNNMTVRFQGQSIDFLKTIRQRKDYEYFGPGVVLLLLPEQTGLAGIQNYLVETENRSSQVYYAATSANQNFEMTVARALARSIGLGDEFGFFNSSYQLPSQDQIARLKKFPNVVYIPNAPSAGNNYSPPPDFKWNSFLTSAQRQSLAVFSSQATNAGKVGLFEGAGGYQQKVYRSTYDCIMSRNFGDPTRLLKTKQRSFCPICTGVIRKVVTGRKFPKLHTSKKINKQQLAFDQIPWLNLTKNTGNIICNALPVNTVPPGNPPKYWTYVLDINSPFGIKISNVKTDGAAAFSQVRFNNLSVEFTDNTIEAFNIPAAFGNNKVTLWEGSGVQNGAPDNSFQRGLKLVIQDNLGGNCEVELTMSFVFRGPVNDFEPGGVASAMKIFPQMSFSWKTGGKRVKKFNGTIEMDIDVTNTHMMNMPGNFASYFLDTNTSVLDGRKFESWLPALPDLLPPLVDSFPGIPSIPRPFDWAVVFDAYAPNISGSKFITGVHGPNQPSKWSYRFTSTVHESHPFVVTKVPRQGAYDNVHVHANTGTSQVSQNTVVEAPFCPHDCFHLHWRWGPLSVMPHAVNAVVPVMDLPPMENFMGWDKDLNFSESNSRIGEPLIPPNQDLVVGVLNQNANLKTVHYSVTVYNPRPGEKQILLEQGCSLAVGGPFKNVGVLEIFYYPLDFHTGPASAIHQAFHDLYDEIRFFSSNAAVQVPDGDQTPSIEIL